MGDEDGDGDLDLWDFAVLQFCYTGVPRGGTDGEPTECMGRFDFDQDEDIDPEDYALFHAGFMQP